jgi:hypothetical protein
VLAPFVSRVAAKRHKANASSFASPSRGAVMAPRDCSTTAAPTDHGLVMAREPLTLPSGTPLWVFGYGSIVWKVGFEYTERRVCYARGWRQGPLVSCMTCSPLTLPPANCPHCSTSKESVNNRCPL